MNEDLKIIKKKYGEEMMHLCRTLFPTILEYEGKLSKLLLDHFAPSHNLYNDIINDKKIDDFKNYIYGLLENNKKIIESNKTPEELLNEAGYDFYECHTEEEIQAFKKYYAEGEKLCTFNGGRLKTCKVFFAVKKNADNIKREDFKNPERQDEYGTSVISIQFTRNNNTLSIKNRYNHTVSNPDATFSNNLDNIIPGLTDSFEKYYNIIQNDPASDFELPNYVRASDGRYYKYNYEINNIYYCPDNIIIDKFEVKRLPKEKYIVMDYFILDLQNKKIRFYDQDNLINDPFVEDFPIIKDIKIEVCENNKIVYITPVVGEVIEIELDVENNIVRYKNNDITSLKRSFFLYSKKINRLELKNVEKIDDNFMLYNENLEDLLAPKLKYVGKFFLGKNTVLKRLYCPNLVEIGEKFLLNNQSIINLDLPSVEVIDDFFLVNNSSLKSINLPKVTKIGDYFLKNNSSLIDLHAPLLERIGVFGLDKNTCLQNFDLNSLKHASMFLTNNPYINVYEIIASNMKHTK